MLQIHWKILLERFIYPIFSNVLCTAQYECILLNIPNLFLSVLFCIIKQEITIKNESHDAICNSSTNILKYTFLIISFL